VRDCPATDRSTTYHEIGTVEIDEALKALREVMKNGQQSFSQ
jgi:hypothetical protein